jgi:hypothetical protein
MEPLSITYEFQYFIVWCPVKGFVTWDTHILYLYHDTLVIHKVQGTPPPASLV